VSWLWAYSDRTSARPGDSVALHVAGTGAHCDVELAQLGRERRIADRLERVAIAPHPTPAHAHVVGCGWPVAARFTVDPAWPPGYYEILLRGDDGGEARHFLVVRAARPSAAVLVVATNTYHAYNWWGGANTYMWIGGPDPAPIPPGNEQDVAVRLSAERPFSAGIMQPRAASHRIVTAARRGFREPPNVGGVMDEIMAGGEGWDCPAGFAAKWEHAFVAWAEDAGYALDYLTDRDLDVDPEALAGRRVAVVVGHSEYWSWDQRTALERFVDAGGGLAIFGGNTCYWQCRWEDGGRTFVAYKSRAERDDPFAVDPARRERTSGLWSSPTVGKPEAALTGLTFLLGGYHRFGLCVARGVGGYTVWRDGHWALAGTDLFWGDVFGDGCRLVGYENDGCAFGFGPDGLPRPEPRLGVPPELDIIATAPAMLAEPEHEDYSRLVPPEAWDVLARAYGAPDAPETRRRMMRGHAVMASFRRGAGEVFNAGTTEWAYGLAARDPFVDRITRNVLDRFLGSSAARPA
jgi:hypothetical protein